MKTLTETLNESLILEMSQLDRQSDSLPNNLHVAVFTNDRHHMTPHFHFYDGKAPNNVISFHIEISILDLLDIKIVHSKTGQLSTKIKKKLSSWLIDKSKSITYNKLNLLNWQAICIEWNEQNENNQILAKHSAKCSTLVKDFLEDFYKPDDDKQ